MAHPQPVDDWVTSIEVDDFAYPGVEGGDTTPDNRCPTCGQFMGSEGHPVHTEENK